MKRTYTDGTETDSANFFIGTEVEKTPAYGLPTLFVIGVQNPLDIEGHYASSDCEHIFFGANHSFNPGKWDNHESWESMITHFLKKGYLCTLDIPTYELETFHDFGFCEYNNFIPQIRVSVPYTGLFNYNAMIKIDDVDFNSTNPGVWCHSLHDLLSRSTFTEWREYQDDYIIK